MQNFVRLTITIRPLKSVQVRCEKSSVCLSPRKSNAKLRPSDDNNPTVIVLVCPMQNCVVRLTITIRPFKSVLSDANNTSLVPLVRAGRCAGR